jgi:dUTP pyrophosphatase
MLNREEIRRLIVEHGLISGFIDLEKQLTPNGFDLSVKEIYAFETGGALDFSNKQRQLPEYRLVEPRKRDAADAFGWWDLRPGAYKVVTNEIVTLPNDMIGMAFTRSSLLRMGVGTQTGVWDAGFSGSSEFLLTVFNAQGVQLKQNVRVAQLLFTRILETEQGYDGIYQKR